MRQAPHVLVDMTGVRPVGFNCDDIESVPLDQPLGDRRPGSIEIAGSMARFADHHHTCIGVAIEQVGKSGGVQLWQGFSVLA
ncbi:hypothetical protein D3C81_1870870 [compost metagenome]